MTTESPASTLLVTHRERFCEAIKSLAHLIEYTDTPHNLIYIDAGSPPATGRKLRQLCHQAGYQYFRYEQYFSQAHGRNLGLEKVDTEFVVFIDNDVFFEPGWLKHLERCAREVPECGAVSPLVCHGPTNYEYIHFAGGDFGIEEIDGRRVCHEKHRFGGVAVDQVRDQLTREPSDCIEYHTALFRMSALQPLLPLDNEIPANLDHLDISYRITQSGHPIYFEPAAVITYRYPGPIPWSDKSYFILQWSDAWNEMGWRRFMNKWSIRSMEDMPPQHWLIDHRRQSLRGLRHFLVMISGWRIGNWIGDRVENILLHRALQRLAPGATASNAQREHAGVAPS